jgi:hypothetical protein
MTMNEPDLRKIIEDQFALSRRLKARIDAMEAEQHAPLAIVGIIYSACCSTEALNFSGVQTRACQYRGKSLHAARWLAPTHWHLRP